MNEEDKAKNERSANGAGECSVAVLAGYARKVNGGIALKVSVNVDSFNTAPTYTTSDGQRYAVVEMNADSVRKVLNGERAVTTLSYRRDDSPHDWSHDRTTDNVSHYVCSRCSETKVVEL